MAAPLRKHGWAVGVNGRRPTQAERAQAEAMLRSVAAGCLGKRNAAACPHLWAIAVGHHSDQAAE
eukprot:13141934-Alexandrium_andersonii.AAC.1